MSISLGEEAQGELRSAETTALKLEDSPEVRGAQPVPHLQPRVQRPADSTTGWVWPLCQVAATSPSPKPPQVLHDFSAGLKYQIWGQITAENAPKCRQSGAERVVERRSEAHLAPGCPWVAASHPCSGHRGSISHSPQTAAVQRSEKTQPQAAAIPNHSQLCFFCSLPQKGECKTVTAFLAPQVLARICPTCVKFFLLPLSHHWTWLETCLEHEEQC